MRARAIICLSAACLASPALPAAGWKPAAGPLKTRWAADVSPERAHPEYPRPQMVRKDWLNLNGIWELEIVKGDFADASRVPVEGGILVPFPIESALSGVMRRAERAEYRRTFEVPAGWSGRRVFLRFGAVDWEAKVRVNGKEVGTHRGGYDGFSFDITAALKASGPQEVTVSVFDPTDGGDQPRGKQVRNPGGIFYTPVTGIWQTVWLEPVEKGHIEDLDLRPDVDGKRLRLTILGSAEAKAKGLDVEAVARADGKEVGRASGKVGEEIAVPVPEPRLWSPDSPFLYDLQVSLKQGRALVDSVSSYFGMRKVEIGTDGKVRRILLNGKFLFQVGPLDQGFWPDGIYTAPTDEALRFDIEATKKYGCNMARKHVKVEPDRWYYWADKLGLLVWQDMPSGNNKTPEAKRQFEEELKAMIAGRRNHPSIVMWVVFNEGWGQYDTERLTAWVKEFDPTRLVNNASGWTDRRCGDVIDMHNYPGPGSPKPEERRAAVLGEFGGLGLKVEGHTWAKETWGYQGMAGQEQLARRYVQLLQRTYRLIDDPGLSAAVYTQTTDVETECNGLMTYDREVLKVDPAKGAAANRGDFPRIEVKPVVPSSREEGQEWRYSFERPAEGWTAPGFDDSSWKAGKGGFGTKGTPGSVVRTEWKTPEIWLRRTVELDGQGKEGLHFLLHHDEDVEVWVNGVLAAKAAGYVSEYEEMPVAPEGLAALKPGKNSIAVHCKQTGGGQYIDLGIVRIVEKAR
jgi:hypothetical protein